MQEIEIQKRQIDAPKELIDDGSYFTESAKWYNDMFIMPFVSRIHYAILFFTYLIGTLLAFFIITNMFPLREQRKIVVFTSRPLDTTIAIKNLKRFDNPASNILMQEIENYIIQRETYQISDANDGPTEVLQQKRKFIRSTSSVEVSQAFDSWVESRNSITTEFVLSGMETSSKIISSKFINQNSTLWNKIYVKFMPTTPPLSAQIYLQTRNSVGRIRKWMITIGYVFSMPDKQNNLNFKVVMYNIKEI
jgi:type IV secretory pathway component VirB8